MYTQNFSEPYSFSNQLISSNNNRSNWTSETLIKQVFKQSYSIINFSLSPSVRNAMMKCDFSTVIKDRQLKFSVNIPMCIWSIQCFVLICMSAILENKSKFVSLATYGCCHSCFIYNVICMRVILLQYCSYFKNLKFNQGKLNQAITAY